MAFFIPIVIAGARFLIPAAARAGLKKLAQSSGAKAAQTAAKKIAQTAGEKLTGAAARKVNREAARKGVGYTSTTGKKVVRQSTTKPDGTRKLTGNVKGASERQAAAGTAMSKAGGRKIANRRLRNAALTAAGVGSLAGMDSLDTSKSDSKEQISDNKTKRQRFDEAFAAARKEKGAGKTFMFEGTKYTTDRGDDKPKASEAIIPKKPTQAGPKPETSQETEKRSSVKPTEKKRDRLFGLDFLPEIDSKEGGDKVNLPFGLGSYETLPQEEDYSKNKKGGSIKRQSGGTIGCGKAMRGFGKAPYKKKGM